MENDLTYRPDVDGLRAVAVVLVLIFHAFPAALPGGFLGVDVFFVISGYVITRRLVGREESLRHFYASRARRLVPALYTTIIVSLVFGFLLLGSDHFKGLAESALAATAGVSNIYFWRTSGYFETDAIYRPLLHLWTLGVEMQFYLVWPALLLLVRKNRGLWVGLATVASFAFVLMLSERVSFNFYNVPGRFFEFCIGAVLVFAPAWGRGSSALLAAGLIAIAASAFLLNGTSGMPGALSLLPCLGAAFAIHSGASRLGTALLASRAAVYLGKRSYSLYLVHWPVIVFWSYYQNGNLTWLDYVAMFPVIALLSEALHRFVEEPFRKPNPNGGKMVLASAVLALGFAGSVASSGGMPFRIPESFASGPSGYEGCDFPMCRYPEGAEQLDIVLIGDSHSRHLFAGFKRLADELGFSFGVFHFRPQCGPLRGNYDDFEGENCVERMAMFADFLERAEPTNILFAARWRNIKDIEGLRPRLEAAVADLPTAYRTAMMLGVPEFYQNRDPVACDVPQYFSGLDTRCQSARRDDVFYAPMEEANARLSDAFSDLDLVMNPFDLLCDDQYCHDKINGVWAYSDKHHLSDDGSMHLIEHFKPLFIDWLRTQER